LAQSPKHVATAVEPGYQLIRRNGSVTPFDAGKIAIALTKAFLAVEGNTAAASRRVHDIVADLANQIVTSLTRRADAGRTFHIEDVQDQVDHDNATLVRQNRKVNGGIKISLCPYTPDRKSVV